MENKKSIIPGLLAFAEALGNAGAFTETSYEYTRNTSHLRRPSKPIKGKLVDVKTEPKIGRNDICPKCDLEENLKRK